ncbi:acyl-CoA dehydrogenase family protein [Marinibaculum pumilum]|uniref:Acyl-CoA dehydrogenase family protein n=1 Tax=Marinibaculum pumilum TaxID=1766165 RepID=A0ABV7L2V8_9PROT
MSDLVFAPCTLPDGAEALRGEVRAFLADELADYPARRRAESWSGYSKAFSRKVGAKGWIGMTWPRQYGGAERSALERYVVLEEMLAAGAPVGAHWIADRQSGPLLLRYGTDEQRRSIVPRIARGEVQFCIGMSEPDSGSDLASVRSRAARDGNGWRLEGRKVWTSGAHEAEYMIALFRTAAQGEDRHAGLSQFLVDMSVPGITVRPIIDLAGQHHFNEVLFDDVRLPADSLIGGEGQGWQQVTQELAYERSGPERFLSCMQLVNEMARMAGTRHDDAALAAVGRLVAHLSVLRQMSLSVAAMLDRGENPAVEAALVKDLGAILEQSVPEIAADVFDIEPMLDSAGDYVQVLAYLTQVVPSYSLRGGTREILRGIIARGLGLR